MGDVQTVVEDEPAEDRGYTLVVAVSNPANVEQLMRTAVDVARVNEGEIRVISVIHKPPTSPFLLFPDDRIKQEFAGDHRTVLDRAVASAEDSPVPVRRSLLVGSDVSDTILSTVETVDAAALLIGWRERPRPRDIVLGRTVDPVVSRAPCDVYVERVGTTADGMDAILLPTVGGPHIEPAINLVSAVARANDATVTVVSYVDPTAGEDARSDAAEHVEAATNQLTGVPVEKRVDDASDVADAIVSAAEAHDFVVLGATRERRLRNRLIGTVAESVGHRATPPIVIAKRGGRGSLFQRARNWW